jgi:hypothetical protein
MLRRYDPALYAALADPNSPEIPASEPELGRTMTQPGGWDLNSVDANRIRLAGDLTNDFLQAVRCRSALKNSFAEDFHDQRGK